MPIPSFRRTQSLIVVWPGDKAVSPTYNGETIRLPARNEIAVVGRGSAFRHGACLDADGAAIPGTVELFDIEHEDPATNGIVKDFDAKAWAEGIYDVNKPLINRGLRIVMDRSEIAAAMEEGRPLWEKGQIAEAENVIREELSRMAYWEKKGQPAPESSSHGAVMEAKAFLASIHLKRKDAFSKNELLQVLGDAPVVPAPVAAPAAPAAPAPAPAAPARPEDDVAAAARALFKAAKDHNVFLKKEEIEGLLTLDPSVMDAVDKKLEEAGAVVA